MQRAANLLDGEQTFYGVFSFEIEQTETNHTVRATFADNTHVDLEAKPIQNTVPDEGLRVLLGSCFYEPNSNEHHLSAAINRAVSDGEIHWTCLMGDQVYPDLVMLEETVRLADIVDGNIFEDILDEARGIFGGADFGSMNRSLPSALLPTKFLERKYSSPKEFQEKFAPE